jgi:hypothetical protein
MALNTDIAAVVIFGLLFVLIWARKGTSSKSTPLPPGPPPSPILGNLRDFTAKEFWVTSANWAKQYG